MSSSFLLNMAVTQCAKLIANYLDGFGDRTRAITPQALEQAARENRPLLTEALSAIPESSLASVRQMFGSLAPDLRREHPGQGHPYMWVLQQPCLSQAHAVHVAVILRHLTWYRQQMDQAVTRLSGNAN